MTLNLMLRFLDMHMYVTSALQRTDMKAVGLQLALDLLHEKVSRKKMENYSEIDKNEKKWIDLLP